MTTNDPIKADAREWGQCAELERSLGIPRHVLIRSIAVADTLEDLAARCEKNSVELLTSIWIADMAWMRCPKTRASQENSRG